LAVSNAARLSAERTRFSVSTAAWTAGWTVAVGDLNGDGRDDVPALFVTHLAKLLNSVANSISLLFNLFLFHERLSISK